MSTDVACKPLRRHRVIRRAQMCAIGLLVLLVVPAGSSATSVWRTPQDLSAPGGDAAAAQVALDAQGDALAVWSRNDVVQASVRHADGGWQRPTNISAAGQRSHDPRVAVNPSGNAIAVWMSTDEDHWVIQAAARPAGRDWQRPQDLSDNSEDSGSADVALDAAGNAIAVWASWNGHRSAVRAAVRLAGGVWQTPQELSGSEGGFKPQVAIDAAGNAIAVWSGNGARAAERPAGGSWGAPQTISSPGDAAALPHIALDPAGNALAVWIRYGARLVVQAAARPAGGAWETPEDISLPAFNWQDQMALDAALDAAGDAVVVWQRFDGVTFGVQAAARLAGGVWEPSQDLSPAGRVAGFPQVALDAAGNAVAVWMGTDDTNLIVQVAARPRGGAWEAPQNLSAAGQNAGGAQIAIDSEGNAVVVWSRSDGRSYIVQASQNYGESAAPAQLCVVPRVVGKTLAAAKAALRKKHCRPGKLRRSYSRVVKKGRVRSQNPKPGRTLTNGARVNLVVSRGRRR